MRPYRATRAPIPPASTWSQKERFSVVGLMARTFRPERRNRSMDATRVTRYLFVGTKPSKAVHMTKLRADYGVTAAISMLQAHEVVLPYASYGVERGVFELPTPDYTGPTEDALKSAVEWIDDERRRGGVTYVHCKAGKGRSVAVVLSALIHIEGMTLHDAHAQLAKERKIAPLYGRSGEIRPQWNTVRRFEMLQPSLKRFVTRDGAPSDVRAALTFQALTAE